MVKPRRAAQSTSYNSNCLYVGRGIEQCLHIWIPTYQYLNTGDSKSDPIQHMCKDTQCASYEYNFPDSSLQKPKNIYSNEPEVLSAQTFASPLSKVKGNGTETQQLLFPEAICLHLLSPGDCHSLLGDGSSTLLFPRGRY